MRGAALASRARAQRLLLARARCGRGDVGAPGRGRRRSRRALCGRLLAAAGEEAAGAAAMRAARNRIMGAR